MTAVSPGPPAPSLARGAALITVATTASRATGFLRVAVVAGAMGTTFLANTYQTANTAPNLVFELLAAGVLTSVFVPTFIEHLVAGRREEGWDAANALASIGLVGLIVLAVALALLAEPAMRLLTLGVDDDVLREREVALGARFLRMFSPQIVFYGLGMIMTAALHAHRRFMLAAVAPIFNNLVVISVYLAYASSRGDRDPTIAGITDREVLLLGVGTTAGVVAMTVCLVPQLARLGWKPRFSWAPSHPAVKKGARLGAWALGYAGGYQAGLIVVLALANRVEGGVAAYQWAYTFFYLPHALFGVPLFSVLFTAMAEKAAANDPEALRERLRTGLGMLVFILLPVAAILVVLATPMAVVVLDHGAMGPGDAEQVGRVLAAFALGLPTYSAFLVLTRAFYALSETRVPALVNAAAVLVASVTGAALFFGASADDRIPGLALGHTIGFALGTFLLTTALARRIGTLLDDRLAASIRRAIVATAVMTLTLVGLRMSLVGDVPNLWNTATTSIFALAAYVAVAASMGAPELERLTHALRRAR
ncbi:MAG TPA: murein biosynthesis integral membrane protein MurJ [Actinomycetota bacterium]|nr:murein biosynthesis integral membrane protein MurJ [Actinomycetota bacterium]